MWKFKKAETDVDWKDFGVGNVVRITLEDDDESHGAPVEASFGATMQESDATKAEFKAALKRLIKDACHERNAPYRMRDITSEFADEE